MCLVKREQINSQMNWLQRTTCKRSAFKVSLAAMYFCVSAKLGDYGKQSQGCQVSNTSLMLVL